MTQAQTPQRVAILGGGIGALTTALYLTNEAGWKERFSAITIYQMGWRLGGKGASGRGVYDRIEEHGLHVWMGFYENAFATIRRVYQEAGRDPGTPLATWQDAFKQHDFIVLAERYLGEWKRWELELPRNHEEPGTGLALPSLWDHMIRGLELLGPMIHNIEKNHGVSSVNHDLPQDFIQLFADLFIPIEFEICHISSQLLGLLGTLLKRLSRNNGIVRSSYQKLIPLLIERIKSSIDHDLQSMLDIDEVRHAYVIVDLSLAVLKGVSDQLLISETIDFEQLDDYDFVDWLKENGASEVTCSSGLVTGMYDLMLAYIDGDINRPSFAAGACLHFAIRMALTYRGSIFWKMQAGMGDTVFAPIYTVLRNRGVEFKFFHAVSSLHLSEDGCQIDSIDILIQATVKDGASYNPLIRINDLDCWPARPDFDQLNQGEELKTNNINLESFWACWQGCGTISLRKGVDFDLVVNAIPVGSLPFIAPELAAADSQWKSMTENVQTTRTLAMQLWLKPSLEELGWTAASPIMDSYQQPFNTWADMTQVSVRENWPENVGNIAYFCGPMQGGIPPQTDVDAPNREANLVKEAAIAWLKSQPGWLWPRACLNNSSLEWSLLVDPANNTGEERFDSQFWRANIDPSERYVLSVSGSTKYRLRTDNLSFSNLFIAGDWVWNPINSGCVEATVMSGMMAANVIKGNSIFDGIVGFNKF
jgi:uncharacterized protein with NAD-binding domain and iron-sulfur cluster